MREDRNFLIAAVILFTLSTVQILLEERASGNILALLLIGLKWSLGFLQSEHLWKYPFTHNVLCING